MAVKAGTPKGYCCVLGLLRDLRKRRKSVRCQETGLRAAERQWQRRRERWGERNCYQQTNLLLREVSIQNGHFTNHHLPSSKGKRIMFCVTFCYLILRKIVTLRSFRNNVCFSSSHAIFSSSYLLKKTKLKLISYNVCNKITYLGA